MVRPPNIVLVVIDSLRARNLGCYGYNIDISPNLDKLALRGVMFSNAFSTTNVTDPSLTSILTGRYPATHGILNQGPRVGSKSIRKILSIPFVSEFLEKIGYKTVMINILGRWFKKKFGIYYDPWASYMEKQIGISRKTLKTVPQQYTVLTPLIRGAWLTICLRKPSADLITDIAIAYIRKFKRKNYPFFLVIHYWDVHAPYKAPRKYYEYLSENYAATYRKWKEFSDLSVLEKLKVCFETQGLINSLSIKKDLDKVLISYDAAIMFADSQIGRLLCELEEIFEDTLIIVTSDHGESLGEHRIFFHHHGLYDTTIHVPLIISGLSLPKHLIINGLVQHVDIAPTLLDIISEKDQISERWKKSFRCEGKSLLPLIYRDLKDEFRGFAYTEEHFTQDKYAIRTHSWKYIESPSKKLALCRYCGCIHGGVKELYNLKEDPQEKRNLVTEGKNGVGEYLRYLLLKWRVTLLKRSIKERIKSIEGKIAELLLE